MMDANSLLWGDLQGEDERRQILHGVSRVFPVRGYESAGMSDIAQAAGLSRGTHYVHFTNKESPFAAAVQQYSREHAAHVFDSLSRRRMDPGSRPAARPRRRPRDGIGLRA